MQTPRVLGRKAESGGQGRGQRRECGGAWHVKGNMLAVVATHQKLARGRTRGGAHLWGGGGGKLAYGGRGHT